MKPRDGFAPACIACLLRTPPPVFTVAGASSDETDDATQTDSPSVSQLRPSSVYGVALFKPGNTLWVTFSLTALLLLRSIGPSSGHFRFFPNVVIVVLCKARP